MKTKRLSKKELLKLAPHYLYPHHFLSWLIGRLSRIENGTIKNRLIRRFGHRYKVNTKEAESRNLKYYPNFNAFYTRALKPEARSITDAEGGIASPVDGTVSQAGRIREGEIVQAKGSSFSIEALLGGVSQHADDFVNGVFATIRLTPADYHRVHLPCDATLMETVHVPGRLFRLTPATLDLIPGLYARNERVISFFDSKAGPMAIVMVGSVFSGSIETVWDGVITPSGHSEVRYWNYAFNPPTGKRGEEMGRFNLGSTVILLFAGDTVRWEDVLKEEAVIKMGQLIGQAKSVAET